MRNRKTHLCSGYFITFQLDYGAASLVNKMLLFHESWENMIFFLLQKEGRKEKKLKTFSIITVYYFFNVRISSLSFIHITVN